MNTKKPIPLVPQPIRQKCPVCGKSAYSSAGIHPQCAAWRADTPRRLKLAAERKAKAKMAAERAALLAQ